MTRTLSYATTTIKKFSNILRNTKLNLYYSTFDTDIFGMVEYTASHKTFTGKAHRRITLSNIYTIYADHKDNISAHDFVAKMTLFLDKLVLHKKMICYRITRMKLGFRSMDLPEFRIDMEFENMQQLDDAMTITIADKGVDKVHVGFNQYVNTDTIQHFLYRDFPDNLNTKKLTKKQETFTIDEVVQATKNICPELWKK